MVAMELLEEGDPAGIIVCITYLTINLGEGSFRLDWILLLIQLCRKCGSGGTMEQQQLHRKQVS